MIGDKAMTKSERDRKYLENPANRAKATARAKAWRARNPDKVRAAVAKWNAANRDRVVDINKKWASLNRDRLRKAAKRFRDKDKAGWVAYNREYVLRSKYGIGVADYEAMCAKQDGRCAICGDKQRLVVDHCHATGAVRGLLCSSCNLGLGRFLDSPVRLRSAAEYLGMAGVEGVKCA